MAETRLLINDSGDCLDIVLKIGEDTTRFSYNPEENTLEDCINVFGKKIEKLGFVFDETVRESFKKQLENRFLQFEKKYYADDDDDDDDDDDWPRRRSGPHSRIHHGINENEIVQDILKGYYSFNTYPIDTCFECLDRGEYSLIPGALMPREKNRRIPRNLIFQKGKRDQYYGVIEKVSVYDKDHLAKMATDSVGTVGVAFYSSRHHRAIVFSLGFINESTNDYENQISYKSQSFTIYDTVDDENNPSGIILYDIDKCQIDTDSSSPVAKEISPYLHYFNRKLSELNAQEDSISVEVDLELLRNYYDAFNNLSTNEDQMILPIIGKPDRIKSLAIKVVEYGNRRPQVYDFYEGKVFLVGKDNGEYTSSLMESEVPIRQQQTFCLLEMNDLEEKDAIQIKRLLLSEKNERLFLINNIVGDRVRVGRIINGITNAITGKVVNQSLVESICNNKIGEGSHYIPDTEYINYLKETYPKLKNNIEQLFAIDKIVQMDNSGIDVVLVQGPPGTGKTELILSLAKELTQKGYNSLITSNVHVACDNVVERLKNQKDLVLKRFKSSAGDQYELDLLENKRRYIENQVLAGFQYGNVTIHSNEVMQELADKCKKLKTKEQKIKDNKKIYDDVIAQYDSLTAIEKEYKSIVDADTAALTVLQQEALSNGQKIADDENQIKQCDVDRNVAAEEERKATQLLRDIQIEYTAKQQDLKTYYAEAKDLSEIIEHLIESKDHLSIECDQHKHDERELLFALEFFRENSIESISSTVLDFIYENASFHNEAIEKAIDDVKKTVAPYLKICNAINSFSNDHKIKPLDNRLIGEISSVLFEYNNRELLAHFIPSSVIDNANAANSYVSLGNFSKRIMAILPFVRHDGLTLKELQRKSDEFCSGINDSYVHCGEAVVAYLREVINESFREASITDLIHKLSTKQTARGSLEASLSQVVKDIDSKNLVLSSNRELIEHTTKDLFDLNTDIAMQKKIIDEKREKVALLNGKESTLRDHIDSIQKESIVLAERIEEAVKKRDISLAAYAKAKETADKLYDSHLELISNYSSYVGRIQTDIDDIVSETNAIKDAMESVTCRVEELVKSGWPESSAKEFVYNYISELEDIKNCTDKQSTYYFTGKGNAFTDMFDLYNYSEGSLISMTTNQVASLLKNTKDLTFDYVIVDEASKCSFEDLIISIPRTKHLVLIGDFMQLDPIYDRFADLMPEYQMMFTPSQWDSLNRSSFSMLFEKYIAYNDARLINSFEDNPFVSIMKRQYRMNKGIFKIISPIYSIHKGFELIDAKQKTYNDVMCININGEENQLEGETSFRNIQEADAIVCLVREVLENRSSYPKINSIGIISGYKAQENYIQRELRKDKKFYEKKKSANLNISIGTFDRFQGREFDLVIVSLVRSKRFGFTDNVRRMNVAFSRAMKHLLIFGNFTALNEIARKQKNMDYGDISEAEKREKEFVSHVLIPTLYDQRRDFVSIEECKNTILRFIEEPIYE